MPERPGDTVSELLKELDLSVSAAARHLGVTRQTLNNLINMPRTSVSPEMALRLETVFGGKVEAWLGLQAAYDAALVRQRASEITAGLKRFES